MTLPKVLSPTLLASFAAAAFALGCESKAPPPAPTMASSGPIAMKPMAEPMMAATNRVEVTSAGFQPARVDVDGTHTLVFRRTTDQTCATAVVFPALGIQKPLPLNTDVVIELPADAKGELGFQCGMGMDRGKVVVR